MGFHNERYFFISGLISFGFFAALLIVIGYAIFNPTKIEQFAMIQSEFISVSIVPSEHKAKEPTPDKTLSKTEEPVTEQAESAPEPKPEKVPDISDLFSSVKAEKVEKKDSPDPKQLEKLNALEKQFEKKAEPVSQLSQKLKNLQLAKPSIQMVDAGGSTGPVVNKYHAKIQGLVYANFHPQTGTEGQSARVIIRISPSGRLVSYKVLAYSGNSSFNSEVDWLKDRLSNIQFPSHPEGKEAVLEFILTAKE